MSKKTSSLIKALFIAVSSSVIAFAQQAQPMVAAPGAAAPQISTEQALEVLGWSMGRDQFGFGLLSYTPEQMDAIIRGFSAAAAGKDIPYKMEEAGPIIQAFMQAKGQEFMEKQRAEAQKQAVANKAAAEKFFSDLKSKEGIMTTPSGLMYEVITVGEGDSPKPEDTVKVNYVGTLTDGTQFDRSQQPVEFVLSQVIPGWVEGLQLMKKGSKMKLYIPSDLGYGDEGSPPRIPPAAPLVFEVELLDITPAASAPAGSAQ